MPDFFTLGTSARFINADTDNQKKVRNGGPSSIYYKATSDVSASDTEVASGASVEITASQYFISAASSSVIVEEVTGEALVDEVRAATATFSSTLAVTGATTLTGGVAGGIPRNVCTWQAVAATSGTDTACTNGTAYTGSVFLPMNATITGIQYLIGSVGGTDKVVASLHSASGAVLANSATAGATVGTAANLQQVAFTSTYAATGPAFYFVALTFNGTTAKFRTVPAHTQNGVVGGSETQTFGTVAAFTPNTTFTADTIPVASLY